MRRIREKIGWGLMGIPWPSNDVPWYYRLGAWLHNR